MSNSVKKAQNTLQHQIREWVAGTYLFMDFSAEKRLFLYDLPIDAYFSPVLPFSVSSPSINLILLNYVCYEHLIQRYVLNQINIHTKIANFLLQEVYE